jgi:hypothetical protein
VDWAYFFGSFRRTTITSIGDVVLLFTMWVAVLGSQYTLPWLPWIRRLIADRHFRDRRRQLDGDVVFVRFVLVGFSTSPGLVTARTTFTRSLSSSTRLAGACAWTVPPVCTSANTRQRDHCALHDAAPRIRICEH